MSLALSLLQAHERPLAWGINDCVQFAAAAVEHYGGWRPSLPTYSSKREAYQIIAAGGGLAALVTRELGPPVHLKDARIGDIALTAFADTGPMLGVVDPPGFWVLAANGQFIPLDLELAIQVWPCRR